MPRTTPASTSTGSSSSRCCCRAASPASPRSSEVAGTNHFFQPGTFAFIGFDGIAIALLATGQPDRASSRRRSCGDRCWRARRSCSRRPTSRSTSCGSSSRWCCCSSPPTRSCATCSASGVAAGTTTSPPRGRRGMERTHREPTPIGIATLADPAWDRLTESASWPRTRRLGRRQIVGVLLRRPRAALLVVLVAPNLSSEHRGVRVRAAARSAAVRASTRRLVARHRRRLDPRRRASASCPTRFDRDRWSPR